MNTNGKTKRMAAAILASFALHLHPSVEAGLIDLLRGPAEPQQNYHRVAFVGSATVKEVKGSAEILVGIDLWKPLKSGAKLEPGDVIRTGDGTVLLRMQSSGSFVKMTPGTILRLAELDPGWDRSALTGQEEQSGFAVRSCRGVARYQNRSGEWRPVLVNTVIAEGTPLRLEKGTRLDLFWTTERRPVRLEGQTETLLTGRIFPHQPEPVVALAVGN